MKPKRRSNITQRNYANDRRKRYVSESSSPVGRKSSSADTSIRPPPEFLPVNYEKDCPVMMKFVNTEYDELKIDEEKDLLKLQYELEDLLSECASNQRRAHGEVQYLTTGEYPKENLRNRPMPSYTLHQFEPASPTSILEREGICGLPSEELDDNLDEYPPPMITSRFWNWCEHDFLANVDIDFLKQFKETILDENSEENLKQYYVNEPWKYRKKSNSSCSNQPTSSNGSRVQRKASFSEQRINGRRNSNKSETPINNNKSHLVSLVSAACRTVRKDSKASLRDTDPLPRRVSNRLHSRDEVESDKRGDFSSKSKHRAPLLVKNEPLDIDEDDDADSSYHTPPVLSPRSLKREREEEEMNGFHEKNGFNGSENGKILNGETPKATRRRNGEMKQPTAVTFMDVEKVEDVDIDANDVISEEQLSDTDAVLIGSKIINKLVDGGFLPQSATNIFEEMSKDEEQKPSTSKVNFNEEGRSEADDTEVDELSKELHRLQMELAEFEPTVHSVLDTVWYRAKAQFAYLETDEQLKMAEYDLFRLGVNMYKENPRKIPTNNEKPVLKKAILLRARKARQHYAGHYRRLRKYRTRPSTKSAP